MATGYAVEAEAMPSEYVQSKKLKKKGNFISRWLINSLKNAVAEEQKERSEMNSIKGLTIGPNTRQLDSDKGIRFQIYKASGGFVVETSMYDRQRDRHHQSLHIITDDQDLGSAIGKIITMETLKQ